MENDFFFLLFLPQHIRWGIEPHTHYCKSALNSFSYKYNIWQYIKYIYIYTVYTFNIRYLPWRPTFGDKIDKLLVAGLARVRHACRIGYAWTVGGSRQKRTLLILIIILCVSHDTKCRVCYHYLVLCTNNNAGAFLNVCC